MKPSTEPSSGNGSPRAAGEVALTLARAVLADLPHSRSPKTYELEISAIAAALDAAYERGRAAGPVVDEAAVERMAHAICHKSGLDWGDRCEHPGGMPSDSPALPSKDCFRDMARAAIAAIPAPPAGEPDRG